MAVYRIVSIFESVTGIPKDRVTNRLHFQTTEQAYDAATALDLIGHVAASYTTVTAPGTASPDQYLSSELSRVVLPVGKAYNPAGGSPLATATWAGFAAAGVPGALPGEVACCLSMNADLTNVPEEAVDDADVDAQPERPASRRRGRIFFGPLTSQALSGSVPERPNAVLKNILLGLGSALANPTNPTLTAVGTELVVRSDSGFAGASYPVIRVSVDDAFDTQRRRGVASTARVTLAV